MVITRVNEKYGGQLIRNAGFGVKFIENCTQESFKEYPFS